MESSAARGETVLVTGGSGFLGGWCVVELLRRGYRVRTTVRDPAREASVRAAIAPEVEDDGRLSFAIADLERDEGWAEAASGCGHVLHVASPFPPKQPKDPDELIVPAREGTLRALRSGLDAGARRVVVTSSVAAIRAGASGSALTEEDWSDPDSTAISPYARSKTIAERAAWALAEERGQGDRLAVVNPGAILGPTLTGDLSYSLDMVRRLLGGLPGVPRIGFNVVDVRDVADLHIRAMTDPAAAGERFIAATRFMWFADVAAVLRERLGADARKVPSRTVPNLVVRAMAIFDPSIRPVLGDLGKRTDASGEKARARLGWSPRPVEETIVDCARSLIDGPGRGG